MQRQKEEDHALTMFTVQLEIQTRLLEYCVGYSDRGTSIKLWRDPVPYLTHPGGEIMAERRGEQKTSRRLSRRCEPRPECWVSQVKKGRKREGLLTAGVQARREMWACCLPSNARSCTWLDPCLWVHPIQNPTGSSLLELNVFTSLMHLKDLKLWLVHH